METATYLHRRRSQSASRSAAYLRRRRSQSPSRSADLQQPRMTWNWRNLLCLLSSWQVPLRRMYILRRFITFLVPSLLEWLYDKIMEISVSLITGLYISYGGAESSTPKSDDQSNDMFGIFLMHVLFIVRCYLYVWMSPSDIKGLDIYMDTGVIVSIAYGFLLMINSQYYILLPFPVSLVTFIFYLSNETRVKETLQRHGSASEHKKDSKISDDLVGEPTQPSRSKDYGMEKDREKLSKFKITAVIPYFMLSISGIYGHDSPVMSHFLLFLCCALGTLTLLYYRLAEVSPALKSELECIQMVYVVMLFITVHTVTAEWLGEVTALVCMPELIAGLLWFSTLLHSDSSNRAVDKVTTDEDRISSDGSEVTEVPGFETEQGSASILKCFIFDGSMFIPPGGAVLAGLITSTYAYEGELLASWNTKATVACGIAGCMPYLSVWMISMWPGRIPSSDKATELLMFAANICLSGACLMLTGLLSEKTLAYHLFSLDDLIDPSVLKYIPGIYFGTAVGWLVPLFVNLAGALLHIDYVMELPSGFAAE